MNIPVGTVSDGREERQERDRGARDGAVRDAQQAHRRATLERRVAVLEAELERKDRRLQSVIDRYERLLEEARAADQCDEDRPSRGDDRLLATVRDALDR